MKTLLKNINYLKKIISGSWALLLCALTERAMGCLLRQVSKLSCSSKGRRNCTTFDWWPPKNGVSETSSHLRSTSSLVFLHKNNLYFQVLVYSYPSLISLLCLSTELILLQYFCHVRLDSGQWFLQNLCAWVWALEAIPKTYKWSSKTNCI